LHTGKVYAHKSHKMYEKIINKYLENSFNIFLVFLSVLVLLVYVL